MPRFRLPVLNPLHSQKKNMTLAIELENLLKKMNERKIYFPKVMVTNYLTRPLFRKVLTYLVNEYLPLPNKLEILLDSKILLAVFDLIKEHKKLMDDLKSNGKKNHGKNHIFRFMIEESHRLADNTMIIYDHFNSADAYNVENIKAVLLELRGTDSLNMNPLNRLAR